MPRRARSVLPDGIYHVTGRGVARTAIFRDRVDYEEFRNHLSRVCDRHGWTMHAYCLMPNHYHLIVQATREDLSRAACTASTAATPNGSIGGTTAVDTSSRIALAPTSSRASGISNARLHTSAPIRGRRGLLDG